MHKKQLQATPKAYGLSSREKRFGVSIVGNALCPTQGHNTPLPLDGSNFVLKIIPC